MKEKTKPTTVNSVIEMMFVVIVKGHYISGYMSNITNFLFEKYFRMPIRCHKQRGNELTRIFHFKRRFILYE